MTLNKTLFFIFLSLFGTSLFSQLTYSQNLSHKEEWIDLRWTAVEDSSSDFSHILSILNQRSELNLTAQDFKLLEDRKLATSDFKAYVPIIAGVPVHGTMLRIWKELDSEQIIQVEARLQKIKPGLALILGKRKLNQILEDTHEETITLSQKIVRSHPEDPQIFSLVSQEYWKSNRLVRIIKVKSKRGTHELTFDLSALNKPSLLNHDYRPFATVDIPVQVYPIYEEAPKISKPQKRIHATLKYLHPEVIRTKENPYESLSSRRYFWSKYDSVLGETPEGWSQGYWTMSFLNREANKVKSALPMSSNQFDTGGILLSGKYASINLHPNIINLKGLAFSPLRSPELMFLWSETTNLEGKPDWEIKPYTGFLHRPLTSFNDAWNRVAQRHSNHDPVTYINQGFDEIQVYYAINRLFEALGAMGFSDPELSTRAFHAFLYDPDISMKDNAYYTNDTINFTTYSPNSANYARSNPIIWHELGHGLMERLMGDHLRLADTGGLSEGMADFIADLVVNEVTGGKSFDGYNRFRIVNQIGFNLTNESHDDGEAYGGVLHDLLKSAMKREGKLGLYKVGDLTLEAMRLTRNHPALTANEWFNHLLFADERGQAGVRAPSELKNLILDALGKRNYSWDGKTFASFSLKYNENEVHSEALGSRYHEIDAEFNSQNQAQFTLTVSLKDGKPFVFKYPTTVKVFFNEGALQGPVHWGGEKNGPLSFTLHSNETLTIPLTVEKKCDSINREDGSCVDYAFVQVFESGESKPVAKKRFYVRVKP